MTGKNFISIFCGGKNQFDFHFIEVIFVITPAIRLLTFDECGGVIDRGFLILLWLVPVPSSKQSLGRNGYLLQAHLRMSL